MGSADAMRRNLSSRVEILTPVEDRRSREYLRYFLDTQLNDRRSAWEMQPDGSYRQLQPSTAEEGTGAQERMIRWTEQRHRQAAKVRKRKPRVLGPRDGSQKV
jgi:polyphosphate kinase